MANIPSDITKIEDARHWCRVNGYSAEATESMVAEWAGNPTPIVEPLVDASPEPETVEWDEEEDEEEDWDYEDEEESEDEE